MKKYFKLAAIIIFSFSVLLISCANQETSKPVSPNAEVQIYKGIGIVKKIDKENGKLTVDHEDISGYMSAMEMNEPVKDKASLDSLKEGDKISFDLERTGSKLLIMNIVKIGEVALINAAEIYKTNCAECHGAKGEGTKKGIPFTSGHALHHSEAEFIEQVTNGEGKKMPAFKDKLSADEISKVVKFVREEIQKDANPSEKNPHQH